MKPLLSVTALVTSLVCVALILTASDSRAQSPASGEASASIVVFGATGKVGQHIVDEALDRGHRVTAVSRDPSQIEAEHARLTRASGNLLDTDSIDSLLDGADVVVVSVRGIVGDEATGENAIQYLAARNIVATLRARGAGDIRFLHVGGSGTLEVEPGILLADELPRLFLPKSLEAEIAGQILVLDYLRTVDDVNWTYITPARRFTRGDRTGEFRIGGDQMLRDRRGRSRISRADFAAALIDEVENAAHPRSRISVAY